MRHNTHQADSAGDACIMRVVILSPSWNTRLFRIATMDHMSGPLMTAKENCGQREGRGEVGDE